MWTWMAAAVMAAGAAQDREPRRVEFRFKEISAEAFLQYVSRVTGCAVLDRAKLSGTITAYSDTEIPEPQVLDFINSILKTRGAVAVRTGEREITVVPAAEGEGEVVVGNDPNRIAPSDRPITAVIPLNQLKVDSQWLASLDSPQARILVEPANNVVILTGPSATVRKFLRLVQILDAPEGGKPALKSIKLTHIRAEEAAKLLGGLLGLKSTSKDEFRVWVKPLVDEKPVEGRLPARGAGAETVKLVVDADANSLHVMGTADNLKALEELVVRFDAPSTPDVAPVVRLFALKVASAPAVATLISGVFAPAAGEPKGLSPRILSWIQEDLKGAVAMGPVKALADQGQNAVLIVASRDQMGYIEKLVESLDKEPTIGIYQLRFADASQVVQILEKSLQGPVPLQGKIVADPRANTVVVTAGEVQQKFLGRLVGEIDRQTQQSSRIRVFAVRNAKAERIVPILKALLEEPKEKASALQRSFSVLSHQDSNTLVVQGSDVHFEIIESLLPQLDRPSTEEEIIEVISVKNTSVKDVSGALGDLLPPGTIPQDKPPKPEEPTTGLKIRPVPERNALLVRGTRASIDTLKAVIEKLDRFAPQVLIRTLIVEVALDDQTQFGVEGLWESGFRLGGDRKFTTSAGGKFIPGLAGFTYQIAGDGLEAKLLLFAKTGRLDVLATPRVLGVNSREASVSFGKRVPTITNSRITPEGSILNVIEYSDVGISMKVEPRVNADGMVTMPIRVEVSDINQTESVPIGTGTLAPTFTQSRADTTVTVRSGRTVVLGGLIRESLEEATTKIPLLGDVPWIGNVFRGNTTTKQKRELMIFLTPVVVFSQEELDRLTADETGSLKAIDVGRLPLERRRWTGWIRE